MTTRAREALEEELGHIHFLLNELKRWDAIEVPNGARRYISERYERQARVLLSVMAERSATEESAPVTEEVVPVQEVAPTEAMVAGAEQPEAVAVVETREEPEAQLARPEPAPDVEVILPPVTTEPIFDAPPVRSIAARVVEETSAWDRLWRPFLYESIAWFLGAFLILAGTLYFVFESWAGMTSLSRSLVVFGMTAFYSVGFSAWGAFLMRREELRNAGRILGLLGSAVAPLAGVALGPMGGMLDGVHPALLVPLLLGWAGFSAVMVRRPAEALDAPSRPVLQLGMLGTTLMMGLAPLAAKLGAPALWLNALPCVLFFVLSRRPTPEPRRGATFAFVLGAPLYLLALFSIRLHVALEVAGTPLAFGTYAPFIAFLLATCLAFREVPEERAADSLSVGVAALQVGCLVLAGTGAAPAFFVTSAVFTWTVYRMSLGTLPRLRWLYPAYFGAYLAYGSSSQLVPGFIETLIQAIKARLGYPPAETLPFQFGALTALPFILVGVVLAHRLMARAERSGGARETGIAEVLLRSTAVASVLFLLLAHLGPDHRPAFWSALALAVICVASGLWFERIYLSIVGACLMLALPFAAYGLFGSAMASVVCAVSALMFAGLVTVCSRTSRLIFSGAVGVLALAGFLLGMDAGSGTTAAMGIGLSGAAALVATWALADPRLIAVAAAVLAVAAPKLAADFMPLTSGRMEGVSPAMMVMALGLVALGERKGRLRLLGVPGILYALLAVGVAASTQTPALGVILLGSAAAVAIASRTFPAVRPVAVILAGLALLPASRVPFVPWSWMTPELSMGLIVLWALGASLAAARWGRSASTLTAGLVALAVTVAPAMVEGSIHTSHGLLLGAGLAALLTARAVHPSVSIVVAAGYAGLVAADSSSYVLLGLSVILSAVALLEERPALASVLAGGRRFALAATVSAVLILGLSMVDWSIRPMGPLMVGTLVLPLLWIRATRRPFFAVLGALAVAGAVRIAYPNPVFTPALPLFALLIVRAVAQLPTARSLLFGEGAEEKLVLSLSRWMQRTLPLLGVAVWFADRDALTLSMLAAALALMPGPRPSVRVSVATLMLAFVPEARPWAAGVLLALGVLEHHRPALLAAFFRDAPDPALRSRAAVGAISLALVSALFDGDPSGFAYAAGVVIVAAFLLSQRWLLTAAVIILALPFFKEAQFWYLSTKPLAALPLVWVALAAALVSARCQSGRVQRALSDVAAKVLPRLEDTWSEPLWLGGALTLAGTLVIFLSDHGAGKLPLTVAAPAGLAALVLMVTREDWMAYAATLLLGTVLVATVEPLWLPVALGGTGLALCLAGPALESRGFHLGRALHHGGCMLAVLALGTLDSIRHVSTPLAFAMATGAAWAVVHRRREREVVGWLATLVSGHVLVMFLGAVFSSGHGKEFILPHLGAVSALLAAVVLSAAGEKLRRGAGHLFAVVALGEVLLGLLLVDGTRGALREALVAGAGLTVLMGALIRRAVEEEDELSAYLAQGAVALGYLGVRLLGMGIEGLGGADSLVALMGGAFFSGLYVFTQREGAGLPAFRRPALLGAFLFPLAGLLTAPWNEPLYAAALLVGQAAHFAALATHPARRGLASLVSAVAFNAALFVVWAGTGNGEPQYYVIPAGLSLLVLLRVFRDSLAPDTVARLRALAVTIIYVAGAWKPLMFNDGGSMLLCVLVCLVGVAAGIALRIRSYVYLGTAFLVTCVIANLARFGLRDHRIGAAFLTLLGLMVVGFMVLLSAHREKLLLRYSRVRSLLQTWEG